MDTASSPINPAIRTAMAVAADHSGAPDGWAAELGMSPAEFIAFLQGDEPAPEARRRMEVWYRLWPTPHKHLLRNAILMVLSEYYPVQDRERVRRVFLEHLYHVGEQSGVE